jgi:hypothetical protein
MDDHVKFVVREQAGHRRRIADVTGRELIIILSKMPGDIRPLNVR